MQRVANGGLYWYASNFRKSLPRAFYQFSRSLTNRKFTFCVLLQVSNNKRTSVNSTSLSQEVESRDVV